MNNRVRRGFLFVVIFWIYLCLLVGSASAVPPSGEILHFDFETGSGSTALDDSGNGNNGTLGANVVWVDGRGGGHAVRTNNTATSIVTVLDSSTLDLYQSDFSMSVDIKPNAVMDDITEHYYIIKKRQNFNDLNGYQVIISKYGTPVKPLTINLGDGSVSASSYYLNQKEWAQNIWTNVLITYDYETKTVKQYRDGTLKTTTVLSTLNGEATAATNEQNLILFSYCNADFDNVNIFNRTVTDSTEISQLAYGGDASSQTYYVSNSGSNSNSGAIDSPLQTITYACSIALPGDTIKIIDGTFSESGIVLAESGLSGHPITIEKYNGTVLLQGSGQQYGFNILKNYITIDGLDLNGYQNSIYYSGADNTETNNVSITNVSAYGIYYSSCTDAIIDTIDIADCTGSAIGYLNLETAYVSDINIDSVDYGMIGTGLKNSTITNYIANGSIKGVDSTGSWNTTYDNFRMTNMSIDGMDFKTNCNYTTVKNGYIDTIISHGLHFFNGAYDTKVENVTFWDCWHNELDFHTNYNKLDTVNVSNCYFNYRPTPTPLTGDVVGVFFHNYNASNIIIDNCDFNYTYRPIQIYNTRNLTVTNNEFWNIKQDDSLPLGNWLLLGSIGDDDTYGYTGDSDKRGVFNATFRDNIIYGPNSYGINVYTYASGTYPLGPNQTYIEDCIFWNNTFLGQANQYLYLTSSSILSDCLFFDNVEDNLVSGLVYLNNTPNSTENISIGLDVATAYPLQHSFDFVTVGVPIAAFSANNTTGTAPIDLSFTDGSMWAPTSWSWDFENDGTIDSTEQNPIWTYDTDGEYTVNLTVSNEYGSDSEIKVDYIQLTNPYVPPLLVTASAVVMYFFMRSRRWW